MRASKTYSEVFHPRAYPEWRRSLASPQRPCSESWTSSSRACTISSGRCAWNISLARRSSWIKGPSSSKRSGSPKLRRIAKALKLNHVAPSKVSTWLGNTEARARHWLAQVSASKSQDSNGSAGKAVGLTAPARLGCRSAFGTFTFQPFWIYYERTLKKEVVLEGCSFYCPLLVMARFSCIVAAVCRQSAL
jgi:hypothetical protein